MSPTYNVLQTWCLTRWVTPSVFYSRFQTVLSLNSNLMQNYAFKLLSWQVTLNTVRGRKLYCIDQALMGEKLYKYGSFNPNRIVRVAGFGRSIPMADFRGWFSGLVPWLLGCLSAPFQYHSTPLGGHDLCCSGKTDYPVWFWNVGRRKIGGGPAVRNFSATGCAIFSKISSCFAPWSKICWNLNL